MSKKTFSIDNSLYQENLISDAIAAFDGYTITLQGGRITIDDENPEYVFDELMNYTLALSLE